MAGVSNEAAISWSWTVLLCYEDPHPSRKWCAIHMLDAMNFLEVTGPAHLRGLGDALWTVETSTRRRKRCGRGSFCCDTTRHGGRLRGSSRSASLPRPACGQSPPAPSPLLRFGPISM